MLEIFYCLAILVFLLFVTLFFIYYFQRTQHFNYWKIRNVPYVKPTFPFGSVKDLVLASTHIGDAYEKMYREFSKERFFGIIDIQNPVLVLRDPDLIKAVLVKDFSNFAARTNLNIDKKEYILRHCINMQGKEWKEMRALLSPAFTTGKIKYLYELMEKCGDCLITHIYKLTEYDSVVDITSILARFSLDIIATCAFGFETDSINNPDCTFFITMKTLLQTSNLRFLKRMLHTFLPSLVKLFSVTFVPSNVTSILATAVRDTVSYREKYNIRRNDFLNTLIKSRHVATGDKSDNNCSLLQTLKTGLSIEQMTAQAFTFFIAGFSTNTSNLTFCLYELSCNQAVQERLLKDIKQSLKKYEGNLTYQAIQDMAYLDQVIHETLRLYGSGQTLTRICTKKYKVPDSGLILEKGTRILIPIYSLHHDPQYFPNPYCFEPERFNSENKEKINPYVYLPFGEGPRNCIARNFGLLQMKLGIATLILNFKVNLSSEHKSPIAIDKRSFVVTPAQPVFLKFTRR